MGRCSNAMDQTGSDAFLALRFSQTAIRNQQRELEHLLAGGQRDGWSGRCGVRRRLGESLLDARNIQAAGVASFEAVKHLAGLFQLSRLVVEDTESGVTAGPLRQQVDSMLQVLGGLRSISS